MNIDLIAKLKDTDAFVEAYRPGDEERERDGKSLLFYALSNSDPESRYRTRSFLLDRGADAASLNEGDEGVLHILLVEGSGLPFVENEWGKSPVDLAEIHLREEQGRGIWRRATRGLWHVALCDEYTVEKFISEDKWGLVIEGTCATCGRPIARTQDVV